MGCSHMHHAHVMLCCSPWQQYDTVCVVLLIMQVRWPQGRNPEMVVCCASNNRLIRQARALFVNCA
jgi:hypothetical protein